MKQEVQGRYTKGKQNHRRQCALMEVVGDSTCLTSSTCPRRWLIFDSPVDSYALRDVGEREGKGDIVEGTDTATHPIPQNDTCDAAFKELNSIS